MIDESFELRVVELVQKLGEPFGPVAGILAIIGSAGSLVLIVAVATWSATPRLGARLGVFVFVSAAVNEVVKLLVAAPRPFFLHDDLVDQGPLASSFGMPSFHAQVSAIVIAWLLLRRGRHLLPWAIAAVLLMALSRVYLGAHSPSQVILGIALGLAMVAVLRMSEAALLPLVRSWTVGLQLVLLVGMTGAIAGAGAAVLSLRSDWVAPADWVTAATPRLEPEAAFDPVDPATMASVVGSILGIGLGVLFARARGLFSAPPTFGRSLLRIPFGLLVVGVAVALTQVVLSLTSVDLDSSSGEVLNSFVSSVVAFLAIHGIAPWVFEFVRLGQKLPVRRGRVGDDGSLFGHARSLRDVATVMWEAGPQRCLAVMVLKPSTAAGPIVVALGLRSLVDILQGKSDGSLFPFIAGVTVVYALSLVSNWYSVFLEARVQEETTHHFERRSIEAVGSIRRLEVFDDPATADKVGMLSDDSASLAFAVSALLELLASVVAVASSLIILALVSPWLLLLVLFAIPSIIFSARSEKVRQRILLETIQETREASELFELALSSSAAGDLRCQQLEESILERYNQVTDRTVRRRRSAWMHWAFWRTLGWFVFSIGLFGAVGYVVVESVRGPLTVGDVLLTLVIGTAINTSVASLAYAVTYAFGASHAIDRLRSLEAEFGGSLDGVDPSDVDLRYPASGLVLDNLQFAYADGRVALRSLDLAIPPGTTVALVGENGAGKTTLLRLIAGLYRPTGGSVTLDGVKTEQVSGGIGGGWVSAVFQEHLRPEFEAYQSVSMGEPTALDDRDGALAAMRRGGSGGLIESLPDGPETQLGTSFDGGYEPSGGQWQRLAIGRGLRAEGPRLLLLDEPTSAIDPISERELAAALTEAARAVAASGGIAVIATHRLTTVRAVDLIVMLDRGRIVECGSHAELMVARGRYADLYSLQERAYADEGVSR